MSAPGVAGSPSGVSASTTGRFASAGAFGNASTIALLNLSLVLALGALASTPIGKAALGTGVVAAFLAATVGGALVAAFARAPGEIAGPASSVTVIYAALGADLVAHAGPHASVLAIWAALSLAVFLTGVIVAAAGYARLAAAIKFMPSPVNAGFVTGIGLLVVWSQVGPVLGLDGRLSRYQWDDVIGHVKPASVLVGAVTAFTVWVYPRLKRPGQPALVGLAVGTALYYALGAFAGSQALGPTLGAVTPGATAEATLAGIWREVNPSWLAATTWHVLPYAAFVAMQVIMNCAVTAASVATIRGVRSDVNRTLKTQGWVNMLCGAIGALPVSSVGSIAAPAARMGTTSRVGVGSAALLFAAVLVAGQWLARIPVAVLSGILIMGGIGMIDRWAAGLVMRSRRSGERQLPIVGNLAIVAAVAGAFVFGSVPVALLVGAVLAMMLLAISLSEATTFESTPRELSSVRVWPAEQAQWLVAQRARIVVFRPRGGLFFGTADQLATHLQAVPPAVSFVVVDLSRTTMVDATSCQIIAAASKRLAARGVAAHLAGLNATSPRGRELVALGLSQPDPPTRWHDDLDHALESIESELLHERSPGTIAQPVDISSTPLMRGLAAEEIETLRDCFVVMDAAQGPLFRRGDPGDSLYVVVHGFVEIRVGGEGTGRSTRLAAFGPGSVFGEIGMLSSAQRTADAVCTEPTRLYELRHEALTRMAARSPALYTRVVENLSRHLANRLVIATQTVEAQR